MSGQGGQRDSLRRAAAFRLSQQGIGIYPPITEPTINRRHIDGPVLYRLDGTLRWLTRRERLALWLGRTDAWSLEAKDAAERGR